MIKAIGALTLVSLAACSTPTPQAEKATTKSPLYVGYDGHSSNGPEDNAAQGPNGTISPVQ
ncbi:hypothetical protein AA23498_0309 [Acetobacter nitrogenifigens DSM 23921 = NBRC 105050]|nr:hypothetical protein AA23498_0309 [Acetobacter nitrogenifigens DSM 23921 = NBRC 105050]